VGLSEAIVGAVVLVGVLCMVLVVPVALVWPLACSRLIPPPLRRWIARDPSRLARQFAIGPALAGAVVMDLAIVGDAWSTQTPAGRVLSIQIVSAIFGGATGVAAYRCALLGGREWAVKSVAGVRSSVPASLPTVTLRQQAPLSGSLARPAAQHVDRQLRNAARWLGLIGLLWYFFGRAIQAHQIGSGPAASEMPTWWWLGVAVLAALGAGVWLARRRRNGSTDPVRGRRSADALREWGFLVQQPATEGVRAFASRAFWPAKDVVSAGLWPWAAWARIDGNVVLVAVQHGQLRNRTGLTNGATRTVCAVKVQGGRLPTAFITGREGVPPQERRNSIDLELEQFNRSLWAWGKDAAGLYAVVHPRAMQALLQELPDGASALFDRDYIAVFSDEPVSPQKLESFVTFATRLAALTPTYLTGAASTQ
jgi:hypothetical protein